MIKILSRFILILFMGSLIGCAEVRVLREANFLDGKLVVAKQATDGERYFGLYVFNKSTEDFELINNSLMPNAIYAPVWTEDGQKIIFMYQGTGKGNAEQAITSGLYVIDANGHNLKPITKEGSEYINRRREMLNEEKVVSPNGKMCAFIESKYDHPNIFVSNIDGSEKRAITKLSSMNTSIDNIVWSRDSQRIAYSRCVFNEAWPFMPILPKNEIRIVNINTGDDFVLIEFNRLVFNSDDRAYFDWWTK